MKSRARKAGFWGAITVSGALWCSSVYGAGFQLYNEGSAEALSLGAAISARRDLLSNTWYNPAALAGSEKRGLSLGVTLVAPSYTYDAEGPEGDQKLEDQIHRVPHLNYVQPLTKQWTAMLALNVPYGLGTEWDKGYLRSLYERTEFRGTATPLPGLYAGGIPALAQEMSLSAFYLTPSLGYRVNDELSVAAGISLVYARFFMESILNPNAKRSPLLPPALFPGYGTDEMEFQGDGYGIGYVLASHYQFNPEWAAGLVFHSPVSVDLEGETDLDVLGKNNNIEGTLRLPPSLTLGLANKTFERWTFTGDIVWTGWRTFDALQIDNQNPAVKVGEVNSPKDWDDALSYRLGAEYQATDHWVLRGGYVYDKSPVPGWTRGIELPCNDRHMFSVGAGYSRDSWGIDLAYTYMLVEDSDPGKPMRDMGEFSKGNAQLLGVSYSRRF